MILFAAFVLAIPLGIITALLGFFLMGVGAAIGLLLTGCALLAIPFVVVRLIEWIGRRKGKTVHVDLLPVLCVVLLTEIICICVWLFMPVDIDLPAREAVATVEAQYIKLYGLPEEEVEKHGMVGQGELLDALLDELYGKTYKHDLRALLPGSYKNLIGHVVTLRDADGMILKKLHLTTDMKGLGILTEQGIENLCRTKRKVEFDYGALADIFRVGEREEIEAVWGGFIDSLFNSFVYDDATGDLSFTIPAEKPEGTYTLRILARGMAVYDPAGKYEPIELHALRDYQDSQSWALGETYTLNMGQSIFEKNLMQVTIDGQVFAQDLLKLVDARYTYKK